jgi:hypothetical protein
LTTKTSQKQEEIKSLSLITNYPPLARIAASVVARLAVEAGEACEI